MSDSPIKKALPSLVTLTGMVLGLVSLVWSATGFPVVAGWFVLYCVLLDKLDGIVARALHVASDFGMEMDSFSDFTTFGIAPAALLWFGLAPEGWTALWTAAACVVYVACAAIRLARFNVVTHEDHLFFSGVPTTFAAAIFASFFLVVHDAGQPAWLVFVGPSILIALAALMVSSLRIPKLRRPAHNGVFAMYLVLTLAVLFSVLTRRLPIIPLVVAIGYLVIGGALARRPADANQQP